MTDAPDRHRHNRSKLVHGRAQIAAGLIRKWTGARANHLISVLWVVQDAHLACALPVTGTTASAVAPQLRRRDMGVRRDRADDPPIGRHQRPEHRRGRPAETPPRAGGGPLALRHFRPTNAPQDRQGRARAPRPARSTPSEPARRPPGPRATGKAKAFTAFFNPRFREPAPVAEVPNSGAAVKPVPGGQSCVPRSERPGRQTIGANAAPAQCRAGRAKDGAQRTPPSDFMTTFRPVFRIH